MNREIKFRMWHKKSKKMFDVESINFKDRSLNMWNSVMYTLSTFSLDDVILMQYTGLHDKNGKEIYEGDAWEDEDGYYIIVWDEKEAGFLVDTYGIEEWLGESGQECYGNKIEFISREPIDYFNFSKIEIIKNIYDNPELLGGE